MQPPIGTAAKSQQTRRRHIGEVDEDPGPQPETADPSSGLAGNHAANREGGLTNRDLVADLHAEDRQQFRADERTMVLEQRVRIVQTALQRNGAIQREGGLNGA